MTTGLFSEGGLPDSRCKPLKPLPMEHPPKLNFFSATRRDHGTQFCPPYLPISLRDDLATVNMGYEIEEKGVLKKGIKSFILSPHGRHGAFGCVYIFLVASAGPLIKTGEGNRQRDDVQKSA